MIYASELREKEIIEITEGRRLGFVSDVEVNLEKGKIDALIVPSQGRFLGLFGKENETVITWKEIKKIGMDVILVELKNSMITRMYEDEDDYEDMHEKDKDDREEKNE